MVDKGPLNQAIMWLYKFKHNNNYVLFMSLGFYSCEDTMITATLLKENIELELAISSKV